MPKAAAQSDSATKRKLLDAAVGLLLGKGFTATTVDDICGAAGVTKGSFFHYFASKEEVGLAAMDHFTCGQSEAFRAAGFEQIADPVERVGRLFDTMAGMIKSPQFRCACVVGNLAQEMAQSNPAIREGCDGHFSAFQGMVTRLLAEAKASRPQAASFDPESVAWMITSLMQGSLLVARTRQDRSLVLGNLQHCRAYVEGLLAGSEPLSIDRLQRTPEPLQSTAGSGRPAGNG